MEFAVRAVAGKGNWRAAAARGYHIDMCPADTSPEAWKVLIGLLRKMPPEEKLQRALEWSDMIRLAGESGLRQAYPRASDREIFLRGARRRLGAELFCRVYGDELPNDGPAHRIS